MSKLTWQDIKLVQDTLVGLEWKLTNKLGAGYYYYCVWCSAQVSARPGDERLHKSGCKTVAAKAVLDAVYELVCSR